MDQFTLRLTLGAEVLSADRRESGILENVVMDSDVFIGIEGSWSLTNSTGVVIDESMEHSERKSYQVHVLLELKLLSYSVLSDTTLELTFEKGFDCQYSTIPRYMKLFRLRKAIHGSSCNRTIQRLEQPSRFLIALSILGSTD